jgi:hypothetical protein
VNVTAIGRIYESENPHGVGGEGEVSFEISLTWTTAQATGAADLARACRARKPMVLQLIEHNPVLLLSETFVGTAFNMKVGANLHQLQQSDRL